MKKFVAGIIARSYSRRSAGALLLVGVVVGATVGGLAVVRATSGSSSARSCAYVRFVVMDGLPLRVCPDQFTKAPKVSCTTSQTIRCNK